MRFRLAFEVAVLSLPVLVPLHPQVTTGSITGRVLDASRAAIAGAEIVATHIETGSVRRAKTGTDGSYLFPNLPIGSYELTATQSGFKKAVEKGLQLHVSEQLAFDITLQVGEITQEVTVMAGAEQVQTETAEQGSLISGEQVRELQLNGRSFFTLLELVPGVTSNLADRTDPNSTPDVAINGARSTSSNITIDGGNNADLIVGSSSMNTFTSIDTIAEFTVVTTPYSAENGRGGFSQINVVTKGGTKNFHGTLFHFLRNDFFDATDYFSHRTLPLKLNNFGYNLGGPLMLPGYNRDRKRTFFFFAQEFNRVITRGEAINTTVPSEAQRVGDFSSLASSALTDPSTNQPFPGNLIPASRIDSNSRKLLDLYPLPNFKGAGTINYTSAEASRQNHHSEMIRIDHIFSDTFKLYGRYTQDGLSLWNPYGGTALSSVTTNFPGVSVTDGIRPGKNAVVNGTQMISSNLVQQFQFTFARRLTDFRPASDKANRKKLGLTLPELFPENDGDVIPAISMTNIATLSPYHVAHKELYNLEFSDNVTKILNRHTIKFGAYYAYGANLEQPSNVNTGGSFSFTTNFSKQAVANFLLGLPNTYTEVEKPVLSDVRFGNLEAYVLDEIRASKRLVLNVGLRYTSYFNPYDINGTATNFIPSLWDPSKAPQLVRSTGYIVANTGDSLNGIVVARKTSPYGDRIANDQHGLFAPRFGFAWSPHGKKTSVRGGWGMYYTRPMIGTFINNAFQNPPFSRSVTLNQPSYLTLAGAEAPSSPPSLNSLGLPLKATTAHQFSVGIQREVAKHQILNVAYVGSRGLRLQRPINRNDPEPGKVVSGVNVNTLRPYLGYGAIYERQTSGGSNYHSLQISHNARVSRRLSAGMAYTWSKSIDDGSSERGSGDLPPDTRNSRAERGVSDFDRKHVFTGNFIIGLPSPIRSPFFRGWQISGVTRLWSGRPFDVVMSTDVAQIGAVQNQRPNVIASTQGPKTVEEWFNRNAFARPTTGTFGNLGRNSLRYPGVNKWDLALFKVFQIAEGTRLQFRGEFFNAFNHPNFSTLGTTLTVTSTGVTPAANNFAVITGTRDARVAQLALKIYF